jgi:hypothetical protein
MMRATENLMLFWQSYFISWMGKGLLAIGLFSATDTRCTSEY